MNLSESGESISAIYGTAMSLRSTPGGEDRLNDLAQAWIDGDHDRVLAAVREHEEHLRRRAANPEPPTLREKIRVLRREGCTTYQIASELQVSTAYVVRVCKDLPAPREPHRKADPTLIADLRSRGYAHAPIAHALGLSLSTVKRAAKTSPSYVPRRRSKIPSTIPPTTILIPAASSASPSPST